MTPGAVTEDDTTPNLSTTGSITFNDVDLIDVHATSVTPDAGNTLGGALTMGAVSEVATTEPGTVGWTYTVADDATDYLAAGQTATEKFTVTIDDGQGGTVDQLVTITVTGTNEAPTITAADDTGRGDGRRHHAESVDHREHYVQRRRSDRRARHECDAGRRQHAGRHADDGRGERSRDHRAGHGWLDLHGCGRRDRLSGGGPDGDEEFTVTIDDGQGGTVDQS